MQRSQSHNVVHKELGSSFFFLGLLDYIIEKKMKKLDLMLRIIANTKTLKIENKKIAHIGV